MLETKSYLRKPFEVTAVRVTGDNIYEVAKWCNGDVHTQSEDGAKYIRVRVTNAINEKQTMAFVGDWVLYAYTGYKVYTDKAFAKSFDPKTEELRTVNEPASA